MNNHSRNRKLLQEFPFLESAYRKLLQVNKNIFLHSNFEFSSCTYAEEENTVALNQLYSS